MVAYDGVLGTLVARLFRTCLIRQPELGSAQSVEAILALDRENMAEILALSGQPFPEEKVRAALTDPSAFAIMLYRADTFAGYAHFLRSWSDPNDLYVASLQIRSAYRSSGALGALLSGCLQVLRCEHFHSLVSGVHPQNKHAIELYQRLGFTVAEGVTSRAVFGDLAILESTIARRIESWIYRNSAMNQAQEKSI